MHVLQSFLLNFWKFYSCEPFEVHLYWHLGLFLRAFFYLEKPLKLLLLGPVEPAPCSRMCNNVFIIINSFSKTSWSHQSYYLLGEQSELRTRIAIVCPAHRLYFRPPSWAKFVVFIWAVTGNQTEMFLMWVAARSGLERYCEIDPNAAPHLI